MEKHKIDFSRKDANGNELLGHLLERGRAREFEFLDEFINHGADIRATFNGKPLLYQLVESSYLLHPFKGMGPVTTTQDLLRALDALVVHGLAPYQPFGAFQSIFEYAQSHSSAPPNAAPAFNEALQKWKQAHPKAN